MNEDLSRITQETLSESDRLLLQLSLCGAPSQEQLDAFLDGWDLDSAPLTEAVLLSYLCKMHPGLQVPDKIGPRLSGLLNYCRFQYLQLVGQFGTYAHALEAQGIPFLVMKGGAMKALRPAFPRWMGDIDLLIPERDFRRAAQVATTCGFTACPSEQSFDLKKDGRNVLDIHHFVMMHTGREKAINDSLFARATPARIFSVPAMMPSREDLLFMTLVNLVRNLSDGSSHDSVIYSFFDVQFLLESREGRAFDWAVVRDNAARTGTTGYLKAARQFLHSVVPGLLPDSELPPVSEKKIDQVCTWIRFRRDILRPERDRIEEFNPWKAIRGGKPFFPYIADRLRFACHKRLQHCPRTCARILRRGRRDS